MNHNKAKRLICQGGDGILVIYFLGLMEFLLVRFRIVRRLENVSGLA